MKQLVILFLAFTMLSFTNEKEPRSELLINIEDIRSVEGKIAILVFDQANGFPGNAQNAIVNRVVDVTALTMNINLGQLPQGNYAIAIIHDKNSNKQFDKNMLGIPKEPFGFSNTERVYFGPPSFAEASIFLSQKSSRIRIRLLEI